MTDADAVVLNFHFLFPTLVRKTVCCLDHFHFLFSTFVCCLDQLSLQHQHSQSALPIVFAEHRLYAAPKVATKFTKTSILPKIPKYSCLVSFLLSRCIFTVCSFLFCILIVYLFYWWMSVYLSVSFVCKSHFDFDFVSYWFPCGILTICLFVAFYLYSRKGKETNYSNRSKCGWQPEDGHCAQHSLLFQAFIILQECTLVWCVQSGQTRRNLFLCRLCAYQRSDCCSRIVWAPSRVA